MAKEEEHSEQTHLFSHDNDKKIHKEKKGGGEEKKEDKRTKQ